MGVPAAARFSVRKRSAPRADSRPCRLKPRGSRKMCRGGRRFVLPCKKRRAVAHIPGQGRASGGEPSVSFDDTAAQYGRGQRAAPLDDLVQPCPEIRGRAEGSPRGGPRVPGGCERSRGPGGWPSRRGLRTAPRRGTGPRRPDESPPPGRPRLLTNTAPFSHGRSLHVHEPRRPVEDRRIRPRFQGFHRTAHRPWSSASGGSPPLR